MLKYELNIDMRATGVRIKALRQEAGLTNQELAETLGITVQALNKWQRGRELPTFQRALMLARVLDVTVEEFVVEEQSQQSMEREQK